MKKIRHTYHKNNTMINIFCQDTPDKFPNVQLIIDERASSLAINCNVAFPDENK